jgi:hypothetical protein
MHGGGVKLALDDHVRGGEARSQVTPFVADVLGDIGRPVPALAQGIGAQVVEQDRRVGGHRGLAVEHVRQQFIFHRDQPRRLFGDVGRVGRHRGDGMAVVEHLVPRQHIAAAVAQVDDRLAQVGDLVLDGGHIRRSGHRAHAGQRSRGRRVDAHDAGVGVRAAQHLAVQQPRQLHIGAVDARPVTLSTPSGRRGRLPMTRNWAESVDAIDMELFLSRWRLEIRDWRSAKPNLQSLISQSPISQSPLHPSAASSTARTILS